MSLMLFSDATKLAIPVIWMFAFIGSIPMVERFMA